MADMNRSFDAQVATMQGFNGVQGQLSQCLKRICNKAKQIFSFANEAVGTCAA
jgi:hypothetical protein